VILRFCVHAHAHTHTHTHTHRHTYTYISNYGSVAACLTSCYVHTRWRQEVIREPSNARDKRDVEGGALHRALRHPDEFHYSRSRAGPPVTTTLRVILLGRSGRDVKVCASPHGSIGMFSLMPRSDYTCLFVCCDEQCGTDQAITE